MGRSDTACFGLEKGTLEENKTPAESDSTNNLENTTNDNFDS